MRPWPTLANAHTARTTTDGKWRAPDSLGYNEHVTSLDAPFGAKMDSVFADDLTRSKEITLTEFSKRPWYNHVIEDALTIATGGMVGRSPPKVGPLRFIVEGERTEFVRHLLCRRGDGPLAERVTPLTDVANGVAG